MKCTAYINGVAFWSLDDAREKGFIRLTKWLRTDLEEVAYLAKEKERIERDHTREVILVHDEWKIALFVNQVAEDWGEEDE